MRIEFNTRWSVIDDPGHKGEYIVTLIKCNSRAKFYMVTKGRKLFCTEALHGLGLRLSDVNAEFSINGYVEDEIIYVEYTDALEK